MRVRLRGRCLVPLVGGAAAVVAGVVAVLAVVGAVAPTPGAIHDLGSLPPSMSVCNRDYVLDALERRRTRADIEGLLGTADLPVTDPGLFPACPPSPRALGRALADVWPEIYVRVGVDAWIGYELQGGP